MNVLAAFAHPDDEVFGCGGTIRKMADSGHTVYCWFYFSGVNCNGVLQEQPEEVSNLLGTTYPPYVFASRTFDNQSDKLPLLEIVRSIERAVKHTKSVVVYTHSIHDLNIDHRRVAEAALVATRPKDGSSVWQVLSCFIPTSTDWAFGQFGNFRPNVYERLSQSHVDAKLGATGIYSVLLDSLYPMDEAVTFARERYWGGQIGFKYAEAFELIWMGK